ncbi:hypothetical protein, partial [Salmonella enterica]|uniref:hypothetical protein n=1 Tax=Salmonella enterica TaxID=28901 RepID=UPI000B05B7EC
FILTVMFYILCNTHNTYDISLKQVRGSILIEVSIVIKVSVKNLSIFREASEHTDIVIKYITTIMAVIH